MQIEVVAPLEAAHKRQGDVLEKFMAEWIKKQGYSVSRNIRSTACELDLYCTNKVSNKTIYVECKAYNESVLSANDLWSFSGKVILNKDIDEGWFVSTGEFSKDAKGFLIDWEKRDDRSKLSIYTSERLIDSLITSGMICNPPVGAVQNELGDDESIGEWILCLSELGYYWIATVLRNGMPVSWVVCNTEKNGNIIKDSKLLEGLSAQKFSLATLKNWNEYSEQKAFTRSHEYPVVEVEIGERWTDYRPSRPEHFVGRKKNIKEVFDFITRVKNHITDSRVLAFTGDSGIGKSSFIAKIRADAKTKQRPAKVFVFAVDVRAASDSSYVEQAFLSGLISAQKNGFGCDGAIRLTNISHPLGSETIKAFFQACERKNQIIIFVLDQFEELYAKEELIDLFKSAQRLMLSAISACTNLIIAFAWKTDSTVPQDHPAYYMWHKLSDHRYEIRLRQFSESDVATSIALFENELGQRLRPAIKKYIADNSQGFPWLLKKFCSHLYNRIQSGVSQIDLERSSFDIASLFEQDLAQLSPEELRCLNLIAENAPMDWFDLTQTISVDIVKALQDKRMVLRKGSKLSLYWDIFQDYVLRKILPEIPFSYMPHAPSLDALVRIAKGLDKGCGKSAEELSNIAGLEKKTVWNVMTDLVQFGIAKNMDGIYFLEQSVINAEERDILLALRETAKRHRIVELLRQNYASKPCGQDQLIEIVKTSLPLGNYRHKTLSAYANKMKNWLARLGLIRVSESYILYEDVGDVLPSSLIKKLTRKEGLFIGDTSPYLVYKVLQVITREETIPLRRIKEPGWRNACSILMRLGLVKHDGKNIYTLIPKDQDILEVLFVQSEREQSIQKTIEILSDNPRVSNAELGCQVATHFHRNWRVSSSRRIGGALMMWAKWIINSRKYKAIEQPPGQKRRWQRLNNNQLQLNLPL